MKTNYYINYLVKGRSRSCPIMFIGDKGMEVGSTIKGYRRYGGKWKQYMHDTNINVCITNENISQTCMYCFSKLDHSIYRKIVKDKDIKTKVKGSFLCRNPGCVLVSNKKAIKSRDNLSALAIGLSGLCSLLFQETFPELSAKISQSNTEFINKTAPFLNARECWDTGHDASNRGKSNVFEKKKWLLIFFNRSSCDLLIAVVI